MSAVMSGMAMPPRVPRTPTVMNVAVPVLVVMGHMMLAVVHDVLRPVAVMVQSAGPVQKPLVPVPRAPGVRAGMTQSSAVMAQ